MARRIVVCITLFVFVVCCSTIVHAQRISRTVLAPSTSVMTPTGGLQWSAGQSATQQFSVGPQRLTMGFQQSYRGKRTLALLRAFNFEGSPGDTVAGLLRLEGLSVVGQRPSALRVTISFNKTLLAPLAINGGSSSIIKDIFDGNQRRITFEANVDQTAIDADFATIDYIVGLGNDSLTVVSIDEVVPVDVPAIISSRDGVFTLLGICREGGARLVDPENTVMSIATAPNPARDHFDLSFELSEDIGMSIGLFNHIGENVLQVMDESYVQKGSHKLRVQLNDIASGTYVLALTINGRPLSTLITVGR